MLSPLLRRSSLPEQPANPSHQSNKRRNHPTIARNPTQTHRNHARARPVNERSPHPPPTQPVFFFSRLTLTRPPKPGWPPRRKPWTTTLPRDLGRLRYVAASGCRAGGKSRALLSLLLLSPQPTRSRNGRARAQRDFHCGARDGPRDTLDVVDNSSARAGAAAALSPGRGGRSRSSPPSASSLSPPPRPPPLAPHLAAPMRPSAPRRLVRGHETRRIASQATRRTGWDRLRAGFGLWRRERWRRERGARGANRLPRERGEGGSVAVW